MKTATYVGFYFLGLAALFLALALRSYRKTSAGWNPAVKTWLRIALIFAAVGSFLVVTQPARPVTPVPSAPFRAWQDAASRDSTCRAGPFCPKVL